MPAPESLPARDRPTGLAVPPARMRLWHDGRPLKRWRYVGLYGEDMMLCAADVRIAGLPQGFWATWDRTDLRERTVFLPRAVVLGDEARGPRGIGDEPARGAPIGGELRDRAVGIGDRLRDGRYE